MELFPRRCRGLANSIAYNIALAIFGGLVRLHRLQQQQQRAGALNDAPGSAHVHRAGQALRQPAQRVYASGQPQHARKAAPEHVPRCRRVPVACDVCLAGRADAS